MNILWGLFFSSLISSVFSLQCNFCQSAAGQCTTTTTVECSATQLCAAARQSVDVNNTGISSVFRGCLEEETCVIVNAADSDTAYSASVGLGNVYSFFSCCRTDKCNNMFIPEPNRTPNGLTCATCANGTDTVCNSTVTCQGEEDHCATIANVLQIETIFNTTLTGCASKSFCDNSELGDLDCCVGNMCNGSDAWLRLDLSLLLMVLIVTIFFQ